MGTLIHAHRGASAYSPENTLAAFSKAIEQDADCIELDVHLSKDNQIVVAHDERLERVSNGTGYINDHTLEELKQLDFCRVKPEYAQTESSPQTIPALSEVFSLVKPTRLTMNIELKTTERLYPQLPEMLVSLANEFSMSDRIIYSSFNHYSLMQIKSITPKARIGLLYNMGMVDPWVYAGYLKAEAIHPYYYVIASLPETARRCHENGVKVNVWTVDDPQAIKLMLKCCVDGIITNKPDVAVELRNNYNTGE